MTRAILAALLLTACAPPTPMLAPSISTKDGTYTVRDDDGGYVDDYALRIAEARVMMALGSLDRVVITGKVYSAGTMWLSIGCVTPGAELFFHGAADEHGALLQRGIDKMATFYPPEIAEAFLTDWGRSRMFTRKTGRELVAMGAKEC